MTKDDKKTIIRYLVAIFLIFTVPIAVVVGIIEYDKYQLKQYWIEKEEREAKIARNLLTDAIHDYDAAMRAKDAARLEAEDDYMGGMLIEYYARSQRGLMTTNQKLADEVVAVRQAVDHLGWPFRTDTKQIYCIRGEKLPNPEHQKLCNNYFKAISVFWSKVD